MGFAMNSVDATTTPSGTSDTQLLQLLRRDRAATVSEIATAMRVTPTAVRQRLARLMGQGLVERNTQRVGRGRPSHRYSLTEKARRQGGSNYADLATALWSEIRSIESPEIRRGLLKRIASALAVAYGDEIGGDTPADRMQSLKRLMEDRDIPLEVNSSGQLPVLTVVDCPYPSLAERDRGVCAMEKMLFAELVDAPLRLSECRLDGHDCCQFETT